jgi:transmembrane 9 superfamily protein 2/4
MRLDHYMKLGSNRVHWISIILSIAVIVALSALVLAMLEMSLSNDFREIELGVLTHNERRMRQLENRPDEASQSPAQARPWKQLQGDVMRSPTYPALFAVLIGMGLQVYVLLWLFLITVTIAVSNVFFRPYLFALAFFYSALTAWVNGFATAKVMKYYGSKDWCFAAGASAIFFPALLLLTLVTVDFVEYWKKASQNVPPLTVFLLSAAWACLAIPLTFLGARKAFQ